MAVRTVAARSAAEMPVVTLPRASIDTVKAVPKGEVLSSTMSGRSSARQRSSERARQIRPRPCLAMKLIASGVTLAAATARSPSFSRSSSSTMMTMRPWRKAAIASSMGAKVAVRVTWKPFGSRRGPGKYRDCRNANVPSQCTSERIPKRQEDRVRVLAVQAVELPADVEADRADRRQVPHSHPDPRPEVVEADAPPVGPDVAGVVEEGPLDRPGDAVAVFEVHQQQAVAPHRREVAGLRRPLEERLAADAQEVAAVGAVGRAAAGEEALVNEDVGVGEARRHLGVAPAQVAERLDAAGAHAPRDHPGAAHVQVLRVLQEDLQEVPLRREDREGVLELRERAPAARRQDRVVAAVPEEAGDQAGDLVGAVLAVDVGQPEPRVDRGVHVAVVPGEAEPPVPDLLVRLQAQAVAHHVPVVLGLVEEEERGGERHRERADVGLVEDQPEALVERARPQVEAQAVGAAGDVVVGEAEAAARLQLLGGARRVVLEADAVADPPRLALLEADDEVAGGGLQAGARQL